MEGSANIGTKKLGSQGLTVSSCGYGCMGLSAFYDTAKTTTEEDAIAVIRKAISLGVTHFDTAEIYGPFKNEVLLGKALKGYPREKFQIATKTGINTETMQPIGKPEYIRLACERSLKNLDMDYIDLYYIHRIDTTVPIEDTMAELKKLKDEGKIKYVGLSEASANTIRKAHKVIPISALQIEWSLWSRDVEEELIPCCRELGIGIVAYSPLGRGFLTGAIKSTTKFGEGDMRGMSQYAPRFGEENLQKNLKFVEIIKGFAEKKKCSAGQVSLAWVLAQGNDVCPIPGTSKIAHLEENMKAVNIKLTEEEVKELNKLIPPNEIQGERYGEGIQTFKNN